MKITNRTILVLILVLAIILRFINYFEIPFTHDEFSAVFRLKFDSFSELIEKGVKIDGHPAGIQVFLYYWTKLFGFDEWIVKLPFAIFGILSVLLIYLIGKKWFNETVGLLSSAFLASLQYTIMYSQIARPYISGLFFSLLMVYYWTNLIQAPNQKFYKNSLLFIISASLCAYNHHFSLLFVAIVGVSGLFFIEKKYLIKYIISGILILILYIPHLNIFIYQLKIGGIEGWLGKPQNDFIIKYIEYIFNFSLLPVIVVVGIFAYGTKSISLKDINFRHYILFSTWFILPFLIGFFYSKYVNAVLQYSVLIFSFSYLFFVLFGHIKQQKALVNLILVSIILIVNGYTLIVERMHYKLLYHSPYLEILNDYQREKQIDNNTLFIIDSHKEITKYYSSKLKIDTSFVWYDSFNNVKDFKAFLENESKSHDKLYLGCLSSNTPLTVPVIQDYFSKIVWQKNFAGGTTYLFSKTDGNENEIINSLDFETVNNKSWSSINASNIIDTIRFSGQKSYLIDNTIEFGPGYSEKLENIISNENNFIDISVKAREIDKLNEAVLVAELEHNGESIYWGGTDFENFIISDTLNGNWETFHHSIKLSDAFQEYDNILLKVYIWNKGKRNFIIDNFDIKLRKGNPVIYGLYEKI